MPSKKKLNRKIAKLEEHIENLEAINGTNDKLQSSIIELMVDSLGADVVQAIVDECGGDSRKSYIPYCSKCGQEMHFGFS